MSWLQRTSVANANQGNHSKQSEMVDVSQVVSKSFFQEISLRAN